MIMVMDGLTCQHGKGWCPCWSRQRQRVTMAMECEIGISRSDDLVREFGLVWAGSGTGKPGPNPVVSNVFVNPISGFFTSGIALALLVFHRLEKRIRS